MRKFRPAIISALVIVGGWVLVGAILVAPARAKAGRLVLEPIVHEAYDETKIDREIAFHEGRVQRDPGGAIGYKMLAEAYLARSRESDAHDFAWKAEDAARKSLSLRVKMNDGAWVKLIQALLEQHRFQDALVEVNLALSKFTLDPSLTALRADILIEIGRVDEAETLLKDFARKDEDPSYMAVKARIASIRGDHIKAIHILNTAQDLVKENPAVGQTGIAWYQIKIATELEALRKNEEAKKEFESALALYPRSYKATLGMMRTAAVDKDWKGSIMWAEKTLDISNSLDAVAGKADAEMALGMVTEAQAGYKRVGQMYYDQVAQMSSLGKGGPLSVRPIDRQFATFALKHGMYKDEASAAAKRDSANRPSPTAK
jgi:tetratricopeptide (TPR) repeat protein